MAKRKTTAPRQWEVKMRITSYELVTCEDCTEEQARTKPFKYSVDQQHLEMTDWEVVHVEAAPE
jgi:hypothetical protein